MEKTIKAANKTEKTVKERKSVTELLIISLVFLLPVIFVSSRIIDSFSLKTFILFLVTYVILFIWSIKSLKADRFKIPFNLISLSAILVVLVNLASSLFSDNFILNFWGRDFGFDTSISLISMFLLFFLGAFMFQKTKAVNYTYIALITSSFLVVTAQLLIIIFPNYIPNLGFFFSNTTNTIGKWFDLGVFVGLSTILTLISLEFLKMTKKIKTLAYVFLALTLILQFLIGFSELWFVLGGFSLIFFIYFLVMSRTVKKEGNVNLPIASLTVLLISFVVLISGLSLNSKAQDLLNINFTDLRPSISVNYEIIKQSTIESPILGNGPATFSTSWINYKPDSVNLSELWDVDFRYGYGLIPTYFATTGSLGIISWLLFFGMFIYLGFISLFKNTKTSTGKYIMTSSFVASLYLWVMTIIYIPSFVNLFLTFIFTSIFVAALYREEFIKVKEFSISENPKYGFIYIFVVVGILIGSITIIYNFTEKFISNVYNQQAVVAFQSGDIQLAEQKIISALSLEQNDSLFINLSDIKQLLALQAQNNTELSDADKSTLFQEYLSGSIQSASAAIEYNPSNYKNFLYLGQIFTDLVSLEIEGVEGRAIEFIEEARRLNPKNPKISLALARIYSATGDFEKAKELINEAIEKKSNYTDAVYLLSQINVQEGEIETAIENVRLTTLIRPNDPVTYFQLGLLQYQNKDFEESIVSFESAVIRDNFYSNAKYFLGLSYEEVGRYDDSLGQFKDLNLLDPDNQEIQFILSNLENGLSPFAGSENANPPIDDEPENREKPPLDDATADSTDGTTDSTVE